MERMVELRFDSSVWDQNIQKRRDRVPTEPFLRYGDGIERVLMDERSQRMIVVAGYDK